MSLQPICIRFSVLLSSHLCICLPSHIFHEVLQKKIVYTFLGAPLHSLYHGYHIISTLTDKISDTKYVKENYVMKCTVFDP